MKRLSLVRLVLGRRHAWATYLTLPDMTYFVFLGTWGGYYSPPYFLESWNAGREFFALISLNNSWNEFTGQISWLQHHFYSFYGLLKNFRFHSKLGLILVAVLGIPQEIAYNFWTSGPMLLKLGQNTSNGWKLKVLKAEPTKWSQKKLLGLEK